MTTEPPTSAKAAEEAQAAERRASLQAFIEHKQHIQPGDGSLGPGYLGYNVSSPGGGQTITNLNRSEVRRTLSSDSAVLEEQEEEHRRDEAVRRQTQGLDGAQGGARSDAVEGYLEKMAREQELAEKKKHGGMKGWFAAHMRRGSKDGNHEALR